MEAASHRESGRGSGRKSVQILIVGLLAGLLLIQCGQPTQPAAVGAPSLKGVSKEQYTTQVAVAYRADHDLQKAQAELEKLNVPNIKQWVVYVADSAITAGQDNDGIEALAELAQALGVASPQMVAYLATPTPVPTDTPLPTATPLPTDTPTPTPLPSDTPTLAPTDTPTATPLPSDTPTRTATPTRTNTPKPVATRTPKPTATNTPVPAPTWSWTATLVGPGQDSQGCGYGNLQIRITVVDANGAQIGGVWIYDQYSKQYQVTGNVDSPDWGPGETKFDYGRNGGGSLCIATGQGGGCATAYTRDMPCFNAPPLDDLYAAGYCNCCEQGASKDRCQQLISEGKCMGDVWGHFSWRVVYKRGF